MHQCDGGARDAPLLTVREARQVQPERTPSHHRKRHGAPAGLDGLTSIMGDEVINISHLYGFGLVDAEAMVVEAKKWRNVPPQHTCTKTSDRRTRYIRADQKLNASMSTTGCSEQADQHVVFLEHVVVRVLIVHPRRGDLEINLISPSGTRSQLLGQRLFDSSNEGFRNWEFMTVHCWGEKAEGTWTLEITDSPSQLRNPEVLGKLKEWTLILHGSSEHPYQTQGSQHSRSRMLEIPTAGKELKTPDSVPGAPEHEEEEEEEYNGPCHHECGDQGCDGPDADHCLNCIHFSLGSLKTGRTCVSHCPLGYFEDEEARRCRRCNRGCEKCVGRGPNECRSCRRGLFFYSKESACVETCPTGCFNDEGPGLEECIQCAPDFLQQEWRCVRTCAPGYYRSEPAGFSQRMCRKCEENCLSCQGPGTSCTQCKDGYSLISRMCIMNATCNNADEVFCEMVKSNRLCEKKLFRQFCCRTCLMTAG
ncbi:hypothetical protein PO909_024278 [Leuciscus waleckii]